MKKYLLSCLSMLLCMQTMAQQVTLNKQRHFPKSVPAGNYSGITWLGGERYAVVNDKAPTAGFHLMTISTDSLTGSILEIRADSFVTSNHPNRDEEGICYVPKANTVFVSGEADGQILEYRLDGQLTGRRLNIPPIFNTARGNGGFEALTYNAATHRFWTTTENTLKADGQKPNITRKIPNLLRLQSFDDNLQPCEQYRYQTDSPSVDSPPWTTDGLSSWNVRYSEQKRTSVPSSMSSSIWSIRPCNRGTIFCRNILSRNFQQR